MNLIINLFRTITQREFSKNVSILVIGTIIAQLIPFAFTPFFARLYKPEDFGLFAFLLAITNPLSIITSLRYDMTIVLAEDNDERDNLLFFSYLFTLLTAVVTFFALLIIIFKTTFFEAYITNLRQVWFFIPFLMVCQGFFTSNNFWLQRQKEFKKIAINKILQTLSISLATFLIGYFLLVDSGLILGYAIGWFVLLNVSSYWVFKEAKIRVKGQITNFNLLKRYKEFPLYNLVPALINNISLSIPIFVISQKFSQSDLGYFNMTRLLFLTPLSILGSAISQVLYEKVFSWVKGKEQILTKLTEIFIWLLAIALLAIIAVYTVSSPFLKNFLGEKWGFSAHLGKIYFLGIVFQWLFLSVSTVLPALNKIKWLSYWQILYFIIISAITFLKMNSIEEYVFYLCVAEVISNAILAFIIFIAIKEYEKKIA